MENPFAHFPQPQLVNQPSEPVGPPVSSSQVASSVSPLAHSSPSSSQGSFIHKNKLQEFTQRSSMQLPVYQTFNEGSMHEPKFRSSVLVDGVTYTSESTFSNRKASEQDVAKHALECISKNLKDEDCPPPIQVIQEDTIFCKSILNEFMSKMNLEVPTYTTIQSKALRPVFVSTLVFNGVTYKGEPGKNKKEAEQLAARVAIQSLLADDRYRTVVSKIIRSKAKFYNALNVKDSNVSKIDTIPAGENRLNFNNTEVETTAVSNYVPTSASLHPSSGTEHPHHEFKTPNSGQVPDPIHLPIAFAPAVFNYVPTSASLHPSSGTEHPRHEFKIPNSGQIPDPIHLPIAFVPAVGQASDVGGNSRKRRKKKKRAKLNTDTQLAVAGSGSGIPFNQTPPCSLAL